LILPRQLIGSSNLLSLKKSWKKSSGMGSKTQTSRRKGKERLERAREKERSLLKERRWKREDVQEVKVRLGEIILE